MPRNTMIIGTALLLLAVATGAIVRGRGTDTVSAQTAGTIQQTVNVSGEGRISAKPDMGIINAGVTARAKTVAEAMDLANQAIDKVRASARANGIEEKDIQTSSISISPQYGNRAGSDSPPPIVGYQASQQLQIKVRAIDRVGKVIDDAAIAAGDLFVMNGLRFTFADPTALQSQARELAYGNAKAKAEELARLGGLTIGAPIAINEGAQAPTPVLTARSSEFAAPSVAAAPTGVSTGELEVTVSLQVNFSAR